VARRTHISRIDHFPRLDSPEALASDLIQR
jgi:hypothetical protein